MQKQTLLYRDMSTAIPIIDVGELVEGGDRAGLGEPWDSIAVSLVDALSTIGFAYIKGHGIGQEIIDTINKTGTTFFDLPTEVKQKYKITEFLGWVPFGTEILNPERAEDLKEAFNLSYTTMQDELWPDDEIPGYSKIFKDFFKTCNSVGLIILKLLGIGLQLEDPDFFVKRFNALTRPCRTMLRLNNYRPVPDSVETSPEQARCGEHTDYGFATLLFQDTMGGLEICDPDGNWLPVAPIDGTIVLNVGDLTQRWTSDRLRATPHRVLRASDTTITRRSIAFFMFPDDDAVVECLDGSNKYEKTTGLDFLKFRFQHMYKSTAK